MSANKSEYDCAMTRRDSAVLELTPEVLLKAYACGIFPMAENADDPALFWIEPEERGIIPLDGFHMPAPARPHGAHHVAITVVCDRDFDAVIDGCAAPGPKRARTWINAPIRKLYRGLFEIGHCHTVEVYDGDALVGGLYGVSLGARVLRREHVPSRARCLEDRAGASGRAAAARRLSAARHAVPHRSPEDVRRGRSAAGALRHACSHAAIEEEADVSVFARALSGADAAQTRLTRDRRNGNRFRQITRE